MRSMISLTDHQLNNYQLVIIVISIGEWTASSFAHSSLFTCQCAHFNISGIFHSPNFPAPLDPSGRCLIYQFVAPTDDYIVQLAFSYFQLTERSMTNRFDLRARIQITITTNFSSCLDFLRIFHATTEGTIDEQTAFSEEFCGNEIDVGQSFFSLTRYLLLHVELSAGSGGFRGTHTFLSKAKFQSNMYKVGECGFRAIGLEGNIFSPNYPYFYPSKSNCTYWFWPIEKHILELNIMMLDLPRTGCVTDFIDIYRMYPRVHLEKLCHDVHMPYQVLAQNGIIMRFFGGDNHLTKRRGFHIGFKYVHESNLSMPESQLAASLISLLSLSLHTTSSDIKSNISSMNGGIQSFNGQDASNQQMQQRYWNAHRPNGSNISSQSCPVIINSPSVDGLVVAQDGLTGTINSSFYTESDESLKCQFIFMGSATERVQITFLYFNLYSRRFTQNSNDNNSTNRCDEFDHLSAKVLIGSRMSRIENFCGPETPPPLMSTKNVLSLDYVLKSTRSMRRMITGTDQFGFVIQYTFRSDLGLGQMDAETRNDQSCHYEFNSSHRMHGFIISPNHPGYYPRNIDCHYIFHGTEKQTVAIYFEYFDVEGFAT